MLLEAQAQALGHLVNGDILEGVFYVHVMVCLWLGVILVKTLEMPNK
jgi:hypothetical protein